jgi:hypothetical protein
MQENYLFPWPPDEKYSNPSHMPLLKFKQKYMGMLVRVPNANRLSLEEDEHLFDTDKNINRYIDNPKYRIVTVHEHHTGDFVDFTIPPDFGDQPFKIGYYILKEK